MNFYPRPPRGGRQLSNRLWLGRLFISIHALREEGDSTSSPRGTSRNDFYPRPPRGGRPAAWCSPPMWGLFLSTPSARRATEELIYKRLSEAISIHALREEGDLPLLLVWLRRWNFYPRPPRGGRRKTGRNPGAAVQISIHALREEGDEAPINLIQESIKFLSTPSARRATHDVCKAGNYIQFLSTPSARRATRSGWPAGYRLAISIHALREEGDRQTLQGQGRGNPDFYPRPPRGGRRLIAAPCALWNLISIHALREEGDHGRLDGVLPQGYFYPRPPRGGRRSCTLTPITPARFLSTPSARRATNAG